MKGQGVDRLRNAVERRVAESSEELADLLMKKAFEGKLESVKMLMKLAEEEEARQVEEARCAIWDGESIALKLAAEPEWVEPPKPEVGDVWDGRGWRKAGTGEFVSGKREYVGAGM